MPTVQELLHAFGVREGQTIGPYKLLHIWVQHIPVVKYHQYRYPIVAQFQQTTADTPASARRQLLVDATRLFGSHRVVYTRFGTPYESTLGVPQISPNLISSDPRQILLESQGMAIRM